MVHAGRRAVAAPGAHAVTARRPGRVTALDVRRARWVLSRLSLWDAGDAREPGRDPAAALDLWERLRAHGYGVAVVAAPPPKQGAQRDPEYHVSIDGGAYQLMAFGTGVTFPAALWGAAALLARHAFDARAGPLDRALTRRGDPHWE